MVLSVRKTMRVGGDYNILEIACPVLTGQTLLGLISSVLFYKKCRCVHILCKICGFLKLSARYLKKCNES